MTTSNAAMEGQYGFVQDLVGSVPELATLVANASKQGATADTFQAMLENTQWWRTNANTARQQVALQASDPTTYQQNLTQAQQHVTAVAAQMGVALTPAQVSAQATADMYQGLNDDQLKSNLGGLYTPPAAGAAKGDVASYQQSLQQLAAEYGVPVTNAWSSSLIQGALQSGQSQQEMLAGAASQLQNQAMSAYPSLSQQLQAGQTVSQIAQPYIAAMSQTLEIPETNISLTDPTIQQALTNPTLSSSSAPKTAVAGAAAASSAAGASNDPGSTSMPLYQFQNQLRSDPRWQMTDNAKQSAYSMVASLGKSFGFAS